LFANWCLGYATNTGTGPDVPIDAIKECGGKVNRAVFDPAVTLADGTLIGSESEGYPAGTLLMMTPGQRDRVPRTMRGKVGWELTYRFLYRPQGWNFFPARDGNFYFATFAASGKAFYDSADFGNLFTQPFPPVNYQSAAG
jgi:hypothetical protein